MTTSDLLRQIEELKTENANLLFANRYSLNVEAETLDDLKSMTAERDALLKKNEQLDTELILLSSACDKIRTMRKDELYSLIAERDALRTIIVNSVSALGTAANVSQVSSIEFLQDVPGEICMTVSSLRSTCERAYHAINGLITQRPIRDLDETMCELANAMKVAT